MNEIAPGLLDWAAFHDGIGQEVHSHYVAEPGVLIDPMPRRPASSRARPRLAVLTNRHHLRHATDYGCPIRCHEAGLHEFEGSAVDVEGFAFGDELAPGVRALEVGVLCPEETALHLAVGDGFVAFADAIIREDDGELVFVPDYLLGDDPAAVRRACATPSPGCSRKRSSTVCCSRTAPRYRPAAARGSRPSSRATG